MASFHRVAASKTSETPSKSQSSSKTKTHEDKKELSKTLAGERLENRGGYHLKITQSTISKSHKVPLLPEHYFICWGVVFYSSSYK